MTAKTPIRTVFDGSNNATGLAEFQSGEFIGLTHGGLGASLSIGTAGQVLKVNSGATALEFGNAVAVVDIDGATDLTGATLVAGDQILLSDGGTEGRVTLSQIDTLFTSTTQTLTNKTIDSASNTLTLDLSEGTLTGTTAEFNTALSDGSFATLAGTETLTNKTISGSSNTLSNIANSSLTNSSITFAGDSGSDSASLGETVTIAGGTNITTAATSNTITINLDSNVVTETSTDTLTNKTINTASNTITIVEADISDLQSYILADSTDTLTNKTIALGSNTVSGTLAQFQTAVTDATLVDLDDAQTLTNKTINTASNTITIVESDISDLQSYILADSTDTLTNKTISGSSNTLSNIGNSSLTNSTITVAGDSGSNAVDLGDTLTVSGTSNEIETSVSGDTITIGLPNDVVVGNDLTVTGNLTVSGTTTTVDTTNTVVSDTLLELGNGTTGTPSNDAGIVIERGDSNNAFMGFDESADKFIVGTGTFTGASTGNLTITTGTMVANVEGNVTGNLTGDVTGNADTATTLETARTIGGVSFNGSANINLPGVNTTGNQDTSGNAATATALETGRTIGLSGDVTATGVSFDGTGNITLSTTIAANSVALGTDTTGNYVATIADAGNSAITVANSGSESAAVTLDINSERIQDIVGAMVTGNTESGITVTYQDADGTLDFTVGTLNQNTTGNAATATALETGRTISLTGDVTGTSGSFDGTGNVSISATIAANSVALGTDTTGNYVATVTGGTGIASSGATSGEGIAHTLSVDLSELTDMTAAMVGTDEFIVLDAGADRRKAANEIGLSIFSNDSGFTTNTGTVTSVTGGNGLTGSVTTSGSLAVGAGTGIDVAADSISVDVSDFMSNGSNNRVVTATGTDAMNAEANMTFDGSTLDVTGAIRATGDITAFYTSDETLKTNIETIENPMDKVKEIKGISYNWTSEALEKYNHLTDSKEVGVIAQDVEKVLPEMVATREDGTKAVRYERMCALLIECVKDLQNQIDELKK